jgi:hypothetical protein
MLFENTVHFDLREYSTYLSRDLVTRASVRAEETRWGALAKASSDNRWNREQENL